MIGQLTGNVSYLGPRFAIIDVSGVGYKVFVPNETLKKLKLGLEIKNIWTHLVVREEVLDLYGFLDKNELDFFELLIAISGVGPKSALSILSLAPPETLATAINSSDASYLTQVSGIGKKIAEKIILELRDKIAHLDSGEGGNKQNSEALLALEALGYSKKEAREALAKIDGQITETSDQIKNALKQLK